MSKKELAHKLLARHKQNSSHYPDRSLVIKFVHQILATLYPHFSNKKIKSVSELNKQINISQRLLAKVLAAVLNKKEIEVVLKQTKEFLPILADLLDKDIIAMDQGDPAASSTDEVILSYPGFFAIAVYRLAHHFQKLKINFFPRMLTEYAHERTGIDIHPAAVIGESFFIDHGTGIVIGETSHIHDRVKLYQGVTLGALVVDKEYANQKRHPTIESDVIIYAHATILGGQTVVGHNSIIGGNVWLTNSVPANSKVYHELKTLVKGLLQN